MTYQPDCTLPTEVLELLAEGGLEALPEAIRLLINTAMLLERQKFIGAGPYERSSERQAHANGFKDKTLQTRVGALTVAVPQVREGGFYPQSLDKGVRSERALKLALAEMYVQGVSTRKVAAITEQLCGFEVSSAQVSRATAELDAILAAWRTRPLGTYRYLSFGCALRTGAAGWPSSRRSSVDRQRGRCGGQARGAGRVGGDLGTGGALAHVLAELGRTRAARRGIDHQRCA